MEIQKKTEIIEIKEGKAPKKNKTPVILPEPIHKLRPNVEKFAQIYSQTGVATTAYAEAYGLNKSNPLEYMTAAANASRLLKNAKVCTRINQLLSDTLNAATLDTQLAFLVNQHDDKKTKLAAIRHGNELLKRTGQQNKSVFQGNTFNLTQLLDAANAPQSP
jgi:hypothetical protein